MKRISDANMSNKKMCERSINSINKSDGQQQQQQKIPQQINFGKLFNSIDVYMVMFDAGCIFC